VELLFSVDDKYSASATTNEFEVAKGTADLLEYMVSISELAGRYHVLYPPVVKFFA
jgi:hypothetical protein